MPMLGVRLYEKKQWTNKYEENVFYLMNINIIIEIVNDQVHINSGIVENKNLFFYPNQLLQESKNQS